MEWWAMIARVDGVTNHPAKNKTIRKARPCAGLFVVIEPAELGVYGMGKPPLILAKPGLTFVPDKHYLSSA